MDMDCTNFEKPIQQERLQKYGTRLLMRDFGRRCRIHGHNEEILWLDISYRRKGIMSWSSLVQLSNDIVCEEGERVCNGWRYT